MPALKKLVTLLLSALLVVGLVSTLQAQGTAAKLLPEVQTIDVGQLATVTLRVEDVQDLYGYQVNLTFDPTVLEVMDADPGDAGIQVGLGTFVTPDYVPMNSADNSLGTIEVVVSQVAPSTAANGSGTLLNISFRAKSAGISDIEMNPLVLASAQGTEIAATIYNAQISVGSATATPTDVSSTATPTSTTPAETATPTATPTPTSTGTVVAPTATPTPTATLPPGTQVIYVVHTGDTLYSIALHFGVTVQALMDANGITNPNYIQVGQTLIIPNPGATPVPSPSTTPTPTGTPQPGPRYHIVRPGDTLYSLARYYGTTVQAICEANHLINPHLIYVGQRLLIPGASPPTPCVTTHVVRYGETLTSIASRYGTTVWTLAMLNHLANPNCIYAGQVLHIPC
jgi:LysM repeat protein